MVLLVLPQSCFWAIHTVVPESSSITMNSRARVIPAIPSAERFLVSQDAEERDSESSGGGQGSGAGVKRATCLHIPVSLFSFLPHVFQRYSPPPRTNSITTAAPRMPRRGAALVSACASVSLTQREWRMLRQERTWGIHCQGEIEREQVDRSKGPGSEAEGGGAWHVHSINQALSSFFIPGLLRWTRHGNLEGRTKKIPRSASQRDCSIIKVYILYTGLRGGPLRESNAQRDFRKE